MSSFFFSLSTALIQRKTNHECPDSFLGLDFFFNGMCEETVSWGCECDVACVVVCIHTRVLVHLPCNGKRKKKMVLRCHQLLVGSGKPKSCAFLVECKWLIVEFLLVRPLGHWNSLLASKVVHKLKWKLLFCYFNLWRNRSGTETAYAFPLIYIYKLLLIVRV